MPPSSQDTPPAGRLPLWLQNRLDNYFGLGGRFRYAAMFYIRVIWDNLRRGRINVLFGQANFEIREQSFAEFYQAADPDFSRYESTTAVPKLVASAHGIVIDLGAGTGSQLERFDASRIAHIYGVEPNTIFADKFTARLKTTPLGQDGKYTLIPCGIEDGETLAKFGVVEGSVDCVVCMQVMCSIPDWEKQVQNIHRLLKPGGEFIFWEHCRNTDRLTRVVQWIWCLVWPSVIGGCRLDRVTKEGLINSADWVVEDVSYDMKPHMMMPRVYGRLVKPQAA